MRLAAENKRHKNWFLSVLSVCAPKKEFIVIAEIESKSSSDPGRRRRKTIAVLLAGTALGYLLLFAMGSLRHISTGERELYKWVGWYIAGLSSPNAKVTVYEKYDDHTGCQTIYLDHIFGRCVYVNVIGSNAQNLAESETRFGAFRHRACQEFHISLQSYEEHLQSILPDSPRKSEKVKLTLDEINTLVCKKFSMFRFTLFLNKNV